MLPPYNPKCNPIEKIWGFVIHWVGIHNITIKLKDVKELARNKFTEVTPEIWTKTRAQREFVNVDADVTEIFPLDDEDE